MKSLALVMLLTVVMPGFQCFPIFSHQGWLRLLREGDSCGPCRTDLCPSLSHCPAGTVLDECGCCAECGNVEGQICDLDASTHFYGKCGDELECQVQVGDIPEPQCVCRSQHSICASDGHTYGNICRLQETQARRRADLKLSHMGPCNAAPVISLPPKDTQNYTGNDIIFGCEVSAYPMPHLEWKKKGNSLFLPGDDAHISVQFGCEVSAYPMPHLEWKKKGNSLFLPGDDAHISVQARGGPQKHGVTGWLQIQGIKKSDEGIYICQTKNKYGMTSASATLKVIDHGSSSLFKGITGSRITSYNMDYKDYSDPTDDEDEAEEYESENSED
ncbi:kazal-type serine protease inhibitor domain-containing protein 1-like [Rhinatrema bivittatum]|uniref:kazal-type serine protease inhibitor domain-containing protein 1-like n=1 Tax=Rhinatrema bivittatum TaxID=194408 RepID=UPI00112E89A3|nr:kazal-type serine protease inhibitor domain-containing protein 1-like [Rhinatrema bivittatum]